MRGMTLVIGVAVAIIAFHGEAQVPNSPGRGDEFGVRTNPLPGGEPPYGDRFEVDSRDTRCGDDYGYLYGFYNKHFGVQGVLVPYTTMNRAADQFIGCGPCPTAGEGMMICWPKPGAGPPTGATPGPPRGWPPGSPGPPSAPQRPGPAPRSTQQHTPQHSSGHWIGIVEHCHGTPGTGSAPGVEIGGPGGIIGSVCIRCQWTNRTGSERMSKYIMAPDYVLEAYKQPRAYERSMAVERACGETEPSRTGTQPKQPPSPPSESPGRTTVSGACVYYMDPSRIDEILRARPGVCSRYGPDQIICQADTSPSIGGGSVPQTETYEAKLKRDIESAVEQQATGPRFDHTRTEILINNYEKPPNWHAGLEVTRRPFSRDYWQLAQQVVKQFSDQGRFVPPDRRSHKIRVVLGREQPASSPAGGSQSGGTPCPYVPGQLLQGHAEQTGTSENRPPLQGGTGTTGYPYPPPQTVPPPLEPPQPVQEYVHGLVWRWIQTDGQKTIFPIRIQVPTNMPLNEYQEGPLSLGPEGQYYNKFGGRLLKQWSPPQLGRGEVPGLFQITRLYTVNGTMETVNMRIPLYSQPPR